MKSLGNPTISGAMLIVPALLLVLTAAVPTVTRQTTPYAGTGVRGNADGALSAASFSYPSGLAYSEDNKTLYVADTYNNAIRAISASGVTTIAGGGGMGRSDGNGAAAHFSNPYALTYDPQNHKIYVADTLANRIREVALDGTVRTIAGDGQGRQDGTGGSALFLHPQDITYNSRDGNLYVVDENNLVRRVTVDGVVTTLAGSRNGFQDGARLDAAFSHPCGIESNPITGELYVADAGNGRIRKVALDGAVTTLAGDGRRGWVDGTRETAEFRFPCAMRFDAKSNSLYVVDAGAWVNVPNPAPGGVRQISLDVDRVITVAGGERRGYQEGTGSAAQFSSPFGIAIEPDNDTLFIADSNNNRIRRLDP